MSLLNVESHVFINIFYLDLFHINVCVDGVINKKKLKKISEGHKNYFKDWCLMNSQPTFLFLTYLNLMNYGHIIKSM